LKDQWSPALTISKVLLSLSSLLTDPNPGESCRALSDENWRCVVLEARCPLVRQEHWPVAKLI